MRKTFVAIAALALSGCTHIQSADETNVKDLIDIATNKDSAGFANTAFGASYSVPNACANAPEELKWTCDSSVDINNTAFRVAQSWPGDGREDCARAAFQRWGYRSVDVENNAVVLNGQPAQNRSDTVHFLSVAYQVRMACA